MSFVDTPDNGKSTGKRTFLAEDWRSSRASVPTFHYCSLAAEVLGHNLSSHMTSSHILGRIPSAVEAEVVLVMVVTASVRCHLVVGCIDSVVDFLDQRNS